MQITRRSPFSGISTTLDLPITEAQIIAYNGGMLVQNAFPNLNADEREFIMTGITKAEWDETFGEG
jgi:hypothetical protein